MTITDLIERLEKAEGPSRELDLEITNAFYRHKDGWGYRWGMQATHPGSMDIAVLDLPEEYEHMRDMYAGSWGDGGAIIKPALFTSSLDAAVALAERVLPGWYWLKPAPHTMSVYRPPMGDEEAVVHSADGPHEAITLVIATLKAAATLRAEKEGRV